MVFNATKNDYISPSIVVVDVLCEAGFQNSTGSLNFNDGLDGGWTDAN